ncbi:hypothetical protein HPB49_015927 [Dermacentor silvarum]|uniref:Uncharacterized protein n=1 Tax=Dermacentor silvarum TaxID=543639 RepID=A0ACB8DJK7_DERSI|nr:hypothetical protein HPB49_015927 [Dermacentor silvarum]
MGPLWIALLAVIVTFCCWFFWQRAWRFSLFKRLGIPGPQPSFIYGNLEELLDKGMAAAFDNWITKYGDVVGYFHGSIPAVLTSDPEMIKQVFVKDGKTITGRQAVGIMKDRTKLFSEMIEVASRKQGGVVNMHDHVLRLAMDVAMGVFHGSVTDVQRGDEAACKLLLKCRQCTGMFGESKMVLINSISELPFLFKPLLKYGLSRGVPMDSVLAYFGPFFEKRRQMDGAKKADLLQTLLNAESEDSPRINFQPENNNNCGKKKVHLTCRTRTLANGTLFIIAAIDAVATPLTFATYLLAMHQDVQDKLREEVRKAVKKDGELTYDNICSMEYLGQVISEALRMYPSLHGFVQRACDDNYEYKGRVFPKDTVIGVPVLRMHYDPRFWNEPEKFDPDRFSSENRHQINPMAYLPFGAGPRNCIASRYSELLMRVTLATLVSTHKVLPSESEPKTTGSFRANFILMVPDKGMWLRTEKLSSP